MSAPAAMVVVPTHDHASTLGLAVRSALDKHLCRCGSHDRVLKAVERASGQRSA